MERLITEALRDHVFRRRNSHREDGLTIRDTDERTKGCEDAVVTLTQELMGLLAEPDINIVCYIRHHPTRTTVAAEHAFNEGIVRVAASQPSRRIAAVHHHAPALPDADVRRRGRRGAGGARPLTTGGLPKIVSTR